MSPQEMQELAELLQNVPGIHAIDLKDVRRLAQLLRETPEIGSIEVKGWFGTGVVITRTAAAPVVSPIPVAASRGGCTKPPPRRDPAQGDPLSHGGHLLQGARARRGAVRQGGQPGDPRP